MVDLLELAVPQRLLVLRLRDVGVVLHLEVEDVAAVGFGGAERGEEEGCLEGLFGGEELYWQVFLGLA